MLNEIWKKIEKMASVATDVNERFKEAQAEEPYKSDLVSELTIRQLVQEAKQKLVKTAISKSLETHDVRNLVVGSDIEKKFVDVEGFNEKTIDRFVLKNYVENADALAFQQLLKDAKRLLPVFWDEKGRRELKVADITKGRKLALHVYWSYGSIYIFDEVVALEKIIQVVLLKEKASKAQDIGIAKAIRMAKTGGDYSQAKTYVLANRILEGFKLYKNGKLEIEFKGEKYARKVARALIS